MSGRPEPAEWMWAQACDSIARAERLQRRFFQLASTPARTVWEPPADVFEEGADLLIVVALPGVAAEAVQVASEPGVLTIRATRGMPFDSGQRIRQLEIPYGYFERRIALPDAPFELVSHELTHGCLLLRLRRIA